MKNKNKYGQYFTIDPIAEFMVGLISHDNSSSVLEPSCGKGVFLSALVRAGFTDISAYEIDDSIDNPYQFVQYESFISSPLDKYDVVIGNPPYIRWKNLEQELKYELQSSQLWNTYFNSLCDYMFIFILKGIEQLTSGGELIFITTEYWMNTTHSTSLRNYMVEQGYISDIYHFKEAPLFEGVCASFIIFRFVKSQDRPGNIHLYQYNKKGVPNLEELFAKTCFDLVDIPQFRNNERWLLATQEKQSALADFEDKCRVDSHDLFSSERLNTIGDFCHIGNGMVSGLDKAFNVKDLDSLNEDEKRGVIKVLKAKDLDQYFSKSESNYFFLDSPIDEKSFVRSYPYINKQLMLYREELDKRYDYGKDIPYWEFVFPRNLSLFLRPEPRILVPCKERVSNKNHFRFVLASQEYFPLQDVTGILKRSNCKESIEYLVAYLNNWRVFEWMQFNGVVKGAIVEFSEAPIASIPYRIINWENDNEVRIHDIITESVSKYIQTKDSVYVETIDEQFNRLFS